MKIMPNAVLDEVPTTTAQRVFLTIWVSVPGLGEREHRTQSCLLNAGIFLTQEESEVHSPTQDEINRKWWQVAGSGMGRNEWDWKKMPCI